MRQVTISVSATSANLGPGFDCLGLALNLRQKVTFHAQPEPVLEIYANGEDANKIPLDVSNLIYQTADLIFKRIGDRPIGLIIEQENHIPIGSGLGSSSAAVLAGMFGANALLGSPLSKKEILQMATDFEGHPDNVAPAVYGGLVLGVQAANGLVVDQIQIPQMSVAIILPDFNLLTVEARAALPREVLLKDAIFNASRVGLLIRALQSADYDKLGIAMQDKLHQPYRMPLIPGMEAAFAAAIQAGAAGVAVSGAGPSLLAFAPDDHEKIIESVVAAFQKVGIQSRSWILGVDPKGIEIKIM